MAEDNVVMFPGVDEVAEDIFGTEVNTDIVIQSALEHDLTNVVVAGTTSSGNIYFASSSGDPKEILWELERARTFLMLNYFANTEGFE